MITCLVRKTVLRNPGKTSSFVWLAGPFSSFVAPTNLPNFSSSEGGSCRDSICLAKACAAAFSLVTTMTFKVGSITNKPAIMAAAAIGSCWEAGITPCCCAAIAVLWLALAPERFPLQADTFSRAAGTAGKQKWSLILPSSARVSELTYVTIIGTRYPELDNFQNDIIQFGNCLQAEQCTRGGFLPIFWDAPYSYIHASTDIGEVVDWITDKFVVANKGDLAVLHNRNKMVNAFTNTEWVSGSGGAIISRSVTSCAGMTAYLVLLAQTRVGFLSGGRGKSFHQLPPQEQAFQKEEAYARTTVALTRAQQICFIMGPLDMRGLVGAATLIGCLKYGACFSGLDDQDDPVFLIRLKDEDLLEAPDDSAFLQSLRFSCARVSGVYPPLALVEAYITEEDSAPRVRRLHLMVVDLHRRRRMADRVLRLLVDLQVDRCAEECLNTLPIPWKQNQEAYQLRYVFGYATTFFGPHGQQNNPCGALMPGKVIGYGWTNVLTWLRWESNTSLMPFALTHKGPGGSRNTSSGHPFLPCFRGYPSGEHACEHFLAYAKAHPG